MVNTTNVSSFQGMPPENDRADRKISGGPLYSANAVINALSIQPPRLWTRKCIADAASLALDATDVADMIRDALHHGTFHGSEWCQGGTNGPWAACDAYVLRQSRWNEYAHKELPCEYYLKFAIARTGQLVLTVSCHTS